MKSKTAQALLEALDGVVGDLKQLYGEERARPPAGIVDDLKQQALEVDAYRMVGTGPSSVRHRETVCPWVYVRAQSPTGEWRSFELGELTSASFDQWVAQDSRRALSLLRLVYGYEDADDQQEANDG